MGQQLVGLSYLIRALASSWKIQSQAETDGILAHLMTESRNALELVRLVARGLTPVAPGPNGLVDALRGVADKAQQLHGVVCDLQVEGAVEVADRQVATHLHHIVQEAVTNAVRHGQARRIVIRLARMEGRQAELSILNDGVDMPAAAPNGQGLGLHIMSYRADLIGGTLTIERGEGGGTRVAVRFEIA
jgi:signal transduction histidine kinase